jgi:transposase-like protein
VEVLRRYSDRPELVKPIQDVLRKIGGRDQTDVPGVQSTNDALGPSRKRLSPDEREAVVMEKSRAGVASRVLAEQYGVTASCIRTILMRERKKS